MNELSTREPTKDEFSLIPGEDNSNNSFTVGLRTTHSLEKYYFRSCQKSDLNGYDDGDGWDEIHDAVNNFAVATLVFAEIQGVSGSRLAPVTALVGAGLYAVASGADFVDSYIIGTDRNIR
jgi:hypothetical protein